MITVPEMQRAFTAKSALEPALAAAHTDVETDGGFPVKSGDPSPRREMPDAERAERRVLAACGAW